MEAADKKTKQEQENQRIEAEAKSEKKTDEKTPSM